MGASVSQFNPQQLSEFGRKFLGEFNSLSNIHFKTLIHLEIQFYSPDLVSVTVNPIPKFSFSLVTFFKRKTLCDNIVIITRYDNVWFLHQDF